MQFQISIELPSKRSNIIGVFGFKPASQFTNVVNRRLPGKCSIGPTFWLGNYIRSFSYGFGVQVRDIWTLRPGFYSEFRYKSREYSGLAWGAILRKLFVLTLFPRLPCSFFQEHVPKMDFFPKRPRQQGAFKYGP